MNVTHTDILIIGSGAAGLSASVYASQSEQRIIVIDKGVIGKSGSTVGAVQIAGLGSWSADTDSKEAYAADIEHSGRGLSEQAFIQALTEDIHQRLAELQKWGLRFDVDEQRQTVVSMTSGHSIARSVSARKGKTGLGINQVLAKQLRSRSNVQRWSDCIVLDLVTEAGQVTGAIVFDLRKNDVHYIESSAVVIASGGIGQLYPVTSNPVQATGDGISLALGAGTPLIDLEQIQFYPVSLIAPPSLSGMCMSFYHISRLYNSHEQRFMADYEPETLENTTRDKLAIAIATEVANGRGSENGGVWMDVRQQVGDIRTHFPHEYELCHKRGVDLDNERAEVGPAAHFMMGGVQTNADTATNIRGLYVAGEAAGGLHGGNRLGNNALSECIVFGARAGRQAAQYVRDNQPQRTLNNSRQANQTSFESAIELLPVSWHSFLATHRGDIRPIELKQRIQSIMHAHVGVIRSQHGLQQAQAKLAHIATLLPFMSYKIEPNRYAREVLDAIEVIHMVRTTRAIVECALQRTESRGAHYMTDFSQQSENPYHTAVILKNGQLATHTVPVNGDHKQTFGKENHHG